MDKELNLSNLLIGREGIKLYTPLIGEVEFVEIDMSLAHPVVVKQGYKYLYFCLNGNYFDADKGECQLFPSKNERDWGNFIKPISKNTPFMCSSDGQEWVLGYYSGFDYYLGRGHLVKCDFGVISGDNSKPSGIPYRFMIPYKKFDPMEIFESMKYNIQMIK